MNNKECQLTPESLSLVKIQEYLYQSTAYLSTSTDYARGYKSGVRHVKENIAAILRESGIDESYPN
ncbi:MAG: hypothetical protein NC453_28955 [Muribaculum sp.]|nr:hypothetical protein [Muribaculum sp.]